ncbi:claudin-10 isoform X1 [Dunckerocampus dactyliophorus]|uniref:claudin-10 isoform X1 n=1 Tax=Dunckerocampus dactyliophorus TaxID=161453 RepID=UPI0024074AB8|nr:claudin-10 isoform X1 [Dunckerocampus dactyliophorus]
MHKRFIQVCGFLISTLGWLFVLCTMAMDFWRITQIGGQGGSFIIKVAWYWSNLWKDCFTDSTAVTNCRDFPVLWSVSTYVQGVRGLLMCGLTLGFFAAVLCFLGMECTYIGGEQANKDKMLLAGAVFHFVGGEPNFKKVRFCSCSCFALTLPLPYMHTGMSDIAAYCLYINRIARTSFAPSLAPGILRYDLGPPIFLGLVGSFFILLGAVFYAVTVYRVLIPKSRVIYAYGGGTYVDPRSRGRSFYTGYYRPSRLYGSYYTTGRSSSSKISKLSATTPEKMSGRDVFV